MKRLLALLAVVVLALSSAQAAAAPLTEQDFEWTYAGRDYALGCDPGALLAAMEKQDGQKPDVLEAESCLFDGTDKEITGKELILGTHPSGEKGADRLESVAIQGGPWATRRGIGVGSTRQEVVAAYGSGFIEDYDQLIYAMGKPYESATLIFQLDLQSDRVILVLLLSEGA